MSRASETSRARTMAGVIGGTVIMPAMTPAVAVAATIAIATAIPIASAIPVASAISAAATAAATTSASASTAATATATATAGSPGRGAAQIEIRVARQDDEGAGRDDRESGDPCQTGKLHATLLEYGSDTSPCRFHE